MSLVTAILDNQTQTDSTGKHVRNHTHAYSTYTQTQEDNVGGWPRNAAVTEISPHTNKERYDMNLILCEFMKSAHELSYMQNKRSFGMGTHLASLVPYQMHKYCTVQ